MDILHFSHPRRRFIMTFFLFQIHRERERDENGVTTYRIPSLRSFKPKILYRGFYHYYYYFLDVFRISNLKKKKKLLKRILNFNSPCQPLVLLFLINAAFVFLRFRQLKQKRKNEEKFEKSEDPLKIPII